MRWKNVNRRPIDGQRRVRKRFLFTPLTLEGETRWLEFAAIQQIWEKRTSFYGSSKWIDECWIND